MYAPLGTVLEFAKSELKELIDRTGEYEQLSMLDRGLILLPAPSDSLIGRRLLGLMDHNHVDLGLARREPQ